ncbi:unnamed protein product [Didymodactylos carnosus]|uniref:Uncharacterized protein n=1 Tax=Didymodactylos carnosus TaxID=1234261 RepID=A0A813WFJ6_9BILA|nr:unnamed protein product [Didymodactylos carnosus]CAF3639143.1 unnamed protein product [Didymodactylos carnosus]
MDESIDICSEWNPCRSITRIKDGFINCLNTKDESEQTGIDTQKSCSPVQRHRFRCSITQPTCLSVVALGNGKSDCDNRFDEIWLGSNRKLSQISCNNQRKHECSRLRQYIELSWSSIEKEQMVPKLDLPFRSYCNTFWDLDPAEDENLMECQRWWICASDQLRCPTGHCIDEQWRWDYEWDCPKAHDEGQILGNHVREMQKRAASFNISTNKSYFLPNTCNQTNSFLCLVPRISYPQFYCIDQRQIGDGRIDCAGAIDESNTMKHCSQPLKLGHHFKCASSNTRIPYSLHCQLGFRCPNRADDESWCSHRNNSSNCQNANDFICWDGRCLPEDRCNKFFNCPFLEDEYMCDYPSSSSRRIIPYRERKELQARTRPKAFQLPRFPSDAYIIDSMATRNITEQLTSNSSSANHSFSSTLSAFFQFGDRCDIEEDLCQPNPCRNGGRMVFWFSSLIAIERVYMTLVLNGQWLKQPHIAQKQRNEFVGIRESQ